MNGNLQEKYNKLLNILRSTGGLAVAFSGGVDSAFLVYAAHEALGGKLLAITAVTQSYPRHEAALPKFCKAMVLSMRKLS